MYFSYLYFTTATTQTSMFIILYVCTINHIQISKSTNFLELSYQLKFSSANFLLFICIGYNKSLSSNRIIFSEKSHSSISALLTKMPEISLYSLTLQIKPLIFFTILSFIGGASTVITGLPKADASMKGRPFPSCFDGRRIISDSLYILFKSCIGMSPFVLSMLCPLSSLPSIWECICKVILSLGAQAEKDL